MSMLLSILFACGGDATDETEVVNATATVTDEVVEVVETTTTDNGTTTEVTTETTTTEITTENNGTNVTNENTETTTTPDEQFRRVRGSLQKPLSFMEDK